MATLASFDITARATDTNDDPVAGAKLYAYTAGTTTPVALYSDPSLSELYRLTTPLIADANGIFPQSYIANGDYKIRVTDANDVLLREQDNLVVAFRTDDVLRTSFQSVSALIADERLAYVNGAAFIRVDAGAIIDAGGFLYEVAASDATDHHVTTAGGVKLKVLPFGGQSGATFLFEAFGPAMDGSADCSALLETALGACKAYAVANGLYLLPAAGLNLRPQVALDLGIGKYLLQSNVEYDDIGALHIIGNQAIISGDFADYLMTFTGDVYNLSVTGIVFEITDTGGVEVDADNTSSARVTFDNCRFVPVTDTKVSGSAIWFRNRSSAFTASRCYFNRVKHPLNEIECDLMLFTECWFGFPTFSDYDDDDSYIKCRNGFLKIDHCMFAGGPSWYTGKVDGDGNAILEYTGVAYVGIGKDADLDGPDADSDADTTVQNGRVSITNTRIGFEFGAGPLINWHVPHIGNTVGDWRGGIFIENVQAAPREEKIAALDGTNTAYLIRLFEMPHQIVVRNVYGNVTRMAVVAPGTGATLAGLRAEAPTPVDFKTDFSKQMEPNGSSCFEIRDVSFPTLLPALESGLTLFEHMRWLELFGACDYFFPSDHPFDNSDNNDTLIKIETFFSDFSSDQRGCLFEVSGGALGSVLTDNRVFIPILGHISVARDETTTSTLFVKFHSLINTSDVDPEITVTAKFDVSGTTYTSIPETDAADATLWIEITHESSGSVRCMGLCVKPFSALWARTRGMGLIQNAT